MDLLLPNVNSGVGLKFIQDSGQHNDRIVVGGGPVVQGLKQFVIEDEF